MTLPAITPAGSSDSVSVLFPCYNEEENIRRVYETSTQVLKTMGGEYEIILVDDGSTDQSSSIMDAIAAADPRVKVIHHPKNLGYGAALRSGFGAAAKTLVFYSDGDGQFDLNELPPILPLMRSRDFVSCYRLDRREGLVRKCFARCWTGLICVLFGLRLKDINCAFKLFKREILEHLELQSTGALISAELLARAARRGCVIAQTGVHHFPRKSGRPSGARPRVIVRALWELLKLYRQIKWSQTS